MLLALHKEIDTNPRVSGDLYLRAYLKSNPCLRFTLVGVSPLRRTRTNDNYGVVRVPRRRL